MYLGEFLFVLTPSPCGHSPYILLRKTQGERVRCISPFLLGSDVIQNDPSCCGVRQGERVRCISLLSLLRCYSKRLAMLRGMVGGRGLKSTNILNFSIAVPRSITGCGVSNRGGVTKWRRGWKRHRISLFIPDIFLSPLTCPVALRRTVLAIGEYTRIIPVNYLLSHNPYWLSTELKYCVYLKC